MEKTKINAMVRVSEESNKKLDELSRNTRLPKSTIVDLLLHNIEPNREEYLSKIEGEIKIEIRFKISESEKTFLQEQAKKSGAKSLTSEIRYRLLNTIYKNKFFTPFELEEIGKLRYEINRIGRNINQILKRLNRATNLDVSKSEIEAIVFELVGKLEDVKASLDEAISHTKERM